MAAPEHPSDSDRERGVRQLRRVRRRHAGVPRGRTDAGTPRAWSGSTAPGASSPRPLPERNYENVAISPDGTRAIVQIREGTTTLWIYDFGRSTLTPIGNSAGSSQAPLWTRRRHARDLPRRRARDSGISTGGRWMARGTRSALTDQARRYPDADVRVRPTAAGSCSTRTARRRPGGVGIWVMRLDGDRTPRRLFPAPDGESQRPDLARRQMGRLSRRRFRPATRSTSRRFPGRARRRQVSTDGGDGAALVARRPRALLPDGTRLMGVTVTPGDASPRAPRGSCTRGGSCKTINGNTELEPHAGRHPLPAHSAAWSRNAPSRASSWC